MIYPGGANVKKKKKKKGGRRPPPPPPAAPVVVVAQAGVKRKAKGGSSSANGDDVSYGMGKKDYKDFVEVDEEDDDDENMTKKFRLTKAQAEVRSDNSTSSSSSRRRRSSSSSSSKGGGYHHNPQLTSCLPPLQLCEMKFDEWGGSIRGRKQEVVEMSRELCMTETQIKKRFEYIRLKKTRFQDGEPPKKILEVIVEDLEVRKKLQR